MPLQHSEFDAHEEAFGLQQLPNWQFSPPQQLCCVHACFRSLQALSGLAEAQAAIDRRRAPAVTVAALPGAGTGIAVLGVLVAARRAVRKRRAAGERVLQADLWSAAARIPRAARLTRRRTAGARVLALPAAAVGSIEARQVAGMTRRGTTEARAADEPRAALRVAAAGDALGCAIAPARPALIWPAALRRGRAWVEPRAAA